MTTTLPADRLWPVVSDVERWPDLLPTVDAVTPVEPGRAPGPGAAYDVAQPRLPRARWTIDTWEPGERFTWTSSAPGVRTTGDHRLVPREGGTEVVLEILWSGPLAWPVRLLYGRLTAAYLRREADAFLAAAAA